MATFGRPAPTAGPPRATLVATLVALIAVAICSSAEARIVPQKGIAKVKLGMTVTKLIAKKGRPDTDRIVPNEILGQQRVLRYGKTTVSFNGTVDASVVIGVLTKNRRQRTRTGVGVGSTEDAVTSGVRGTRCRSEFGFRHCFKGKRKPGKVITDFVIKKRTGRVKWVLVAVVID